MRDVLAVVHSSLGHAAVRRIGIVTNHEDIIFGFQVEVGGDFAARGEHEGVILEERVVSDTGCP